MNAFAIIDENRSENIFSNRTVRLCLGVWRGEGRVLEKRKEQVE